jgi:predicted Zn-dependent peptidase
MTSLLVYPPMLKEEQVLAAYDAVLGELADKGPSQKDLDRVIAKMRSDIYSNLEIPVNRASALSHSVLFDGSFEGTYQLPADLAKVTPAQVKAFARKYLVRTNRTIINRVPAADQGAEGKQGQGVAP